MIKTIALRFRDFDAPTIEEHIAVIRREGSVWWGWWKKEHEPDHEDVFSRLRDRLVKSKIINIGLFDSRINEYYIATINNVQFKVGGLSSPDSNRTPSYYRDAQVAAWLELTRIDNVSQDEYVREIGVWPSGESTLVVASDDDQPSLGSPSRITLNGNTILHITDLHFGEDYAFPTKLAPGSTPLDHVLVRDLRSRGCLDDVGLLIVSGDLTTRADTDALSDARLFIEQLSDQLSISRDCVVIVPGNHDIPVKDYSPTDYSHERKFVDQLQLFYGNRTPLYRLHRYCLPSGRPLEVLAMHSVKLRSKALMTYGYVEWQAYDDLLIKEKYDREAVSIAVVHHHLIQAPLEEQFDLEWPGASFSTTLDSGAVLEGLQRWEFDLILNGHQHVPSLTRLARGWREDNGETLHGLDDQLWILSGGSAGAVSTRLYDEFRYNSYNIIKVEEIMSACSIAVSKYAPHARPETHFRTSIAVRSLS